MAAKHVAHLINQMVQSLHVGDSNLLATALVSKNSLAYVEQVFALNEARRLLVNVAEESLVGTLAGITVDECIDAGERFGWFSDHHALIHDDAPAQVTYTSGTEGKPKGILLTYANLADTAARIIAEMNMTSDIREYVGVPATYSFGIGRFRAISAVGGKAYLSPRQFDPTEFASMLRSGEINALSAVPTLLRLILATPDIFAEPGKQLRWLEIGSQFMSATEKLRIRELFPNAKIVQHYGLTEASRSTFLAVSDVATDLLETVGRPVGKTEVSISEDSHIKIRGPNVAKWRIDSDGLHDLCDSEGWLVTNDLGHMQDDFLCFDGRSDDLINCGGIKIHPDMLESRIRDLLGQELKLAVTKVPDPTRGEGILVAIQSGPEILEQVQESTIAALGEMGVEAGASLHFRLVESIPKTATGKPQRRVLTDIYSEETSEESRNPATTESAEKPSDVLGFFEHLFPGRTVGKRDSFETLGGDSLSYIRFSLNFERRFGALPDHWENLSVAQLQRHVDATEKSMWRRLEAVTLTRAIGMICIVALHFETFIYSQNWGAAYFLYMLAGFSVTRFQLPEIDRTGSVKVLLGTVQRIAIPTILVVIVLQLKAREFEILPLLLISNLFDPAQYEVAYFYFVEIYIQLLLLAAILFSIPSVRTAFRKHPMLSALVLLIVVGGIGSFVRNFLWDTNYLYNRVPHNYAWCFACGMLMANANGLAGRLLAIAVIAFASWMWWGNTSAMYWVVGGCAVVLFVREFWVMAPVKTAIAEIAGASVFIYLTHWNLITIVPRIFGEPKPWVSFFVALAVGIVFAHVYNWGEDQVRSLFKSRKPGASHEESQPV